MAAQEQAIRTRLSNIVLIKSIFPLFAEFAGDHEETLAHIINECENLAQKQYEYWRHAKVAQVIHWQLCKEHNLEHNEKWYDHRPNAVVETYKAPLGYETPDR